MVCIEENWKPLIYNNINYGDRFEISNYGNIRNVKTKHIYKCHINKNGYLQVCVSLGSRKNKIVVKIHRAVAENFVANPANKKSVNHIDGNKLNNYYENLEWVTNKENTHHALENDLLTYRKLSTKDIIYIFSIKSKYKNMNNTEIAQRFNVSEATIRDIMKGRTWTYLTNKL